MAFSKKRKSFKKRYHKKRFSGFKQKIKKAARRIKKRTFTKKVKAIINRGAETKFQNIGGTVASIISSAAQVTVSKLIEWNTITAPAQGDAIN